MSHRKTSALAALILAGALLGGNGTAHAQSTTDGRNLFFGAGLGFGVTFNGGQAYFKLEENIGYHVFNVQNHPGLFIALSLGQQIANAVGLSFAGRVGFDAVVYENQDLRVQVTPTLALGVGVLIVNGDAGAGFYMNPALEASIVLVHGLLTIFYRPLGFDILIRDFGGAAYHMIAGAYVNL